MATIDEAKIREIVAQVVGSMTSQGVGQGASATAAPKTAASVKKVSGHGIFASPEDAIDAAVNAQRELARLTLEQRGKIVDAMREVGRRHARELAQFAVDETGIGRVEHKIEKNEGAANLSPGVEDIKSDAVTNETGALLVERVAVGVINAITPTTNPTSTVINNGIIMVAAGNAVVFSPHPRAANCSLQTMVYLNDAIVSAGGPRNLLTALAEPSLRHAKTLMEHDKVNAISATGGGGVVKAALSAGKKAWAAGPGNPPAVIDETADLVNAAHSVVDGAGFDNDVLCIGEKSCFIVESVADRVIREMQNHGGHLIRQHEIPALLKVVYPDGHVNGEMIGKDAGVILQAAGIRAPRDAKVVLVETPKDHTFVIEEFLMPIVPLVRSKTFEDAVAGAVVAESGNHHTAMLHTNRLDRVRYFSQALQVGIMVVNAPSFTCGGLGGPGFLAMTVAGRTGEGFTKPSHFTVERRMSLIGSLSIHTR